MSKKSLKVVVLNGSPKLKYSNTELILNPFVEGMKEAGAEVEEFKLIKMSIRPCLGCLHCWIKKPGVCCQNDDMQVLYPKLHQADLWVMASPVYVDGVAGPMKNFTDRTIPLMKPFFNLRDGHCRHVLHEDHKYGKVVFLSNCGFWEMDNFDPALQFIKGMCKNVHKEFSGAVLRPHGQAMYPLLKQGESLEDIFSAAHKAGQQIIEQGTMDPDTVDAISRELLPLDQYVELINGNFARILEKLEIKSKLED